MKKVFLLVVLFASFAVKAQEFNIISNVDTLAIGGNLYSLAIEVDNPSAASLEININTNQQWLSLTILDNENAVLSGTPPNSYIVNEPVVIVVTDGTTIKRKTFLLDIQEKVSTADFEALKKLYEATNGDSWYNKANWDFSINNVSSEWYGLSVTLDGKIKDIKLNSNHLVGVIPEEIGSFSFLQILNLQNNQLSGSLPKTIGGLTNLRDLFLFKNQLSGNLPTEITNLYKLSQMQLSENNFSGIVFSDISNLSNLTLLDISSNSFSGDFPSEIAALTKIKNVLLNNNNFQNIPDFSAVPSIEKIRLANNFFFFDDLEINASLLKNASNQPDIVRYAPQKINEFSYNGNNNVLYNKGRSFSFSIDVPGVNNRYQWYKINGVDELAVSTISSSPVYIKSNATEADAGAYICKVTNTQFPSLEYESTAATCIFNHIPNFVSGENEFAVQDMLYSYNIVASDPDAWDDVTITATFPTATSWLNFEDLGGGKAVLWGTPQNVHAEKSFDITLQASDGFTDVPAVQSFQLEVTNSNDPPTDINLSNNVIGEHADILSFIGFLETADPDVSDNFQYTMVSDEFKIVNGKLYTNAKFNYETRKSYTLTISSTDKGGITISRQFTINILDENDIPLIKATNYLTVENAAEGTLVMAFSTVDEDDNEHTYSFDAGTTANDNSKFIISGNKLLIAESPDYEKQSLYKVRIKTTDDGGAFNFGNYSIDIKNVNDEAPRFLPAAFSIVFDENQVYENNIYTVNATDPDLLDEITYQIRPSVYPFKINSDGGVYLSRAIDFDYETNPKIAFSIYAKDGKFETPQPFTIYINDVNEAPSFNKIPLMEAKENSGEHSFVISGIDDGDKNPNQTLSFLQTVDNKSLIPDVQIDYTQGETTALVRYIVDGYIGGTANISITLSDDASGTKGAPLSFSQNVSVQVPAENNGPQIIVDKSNFETYEQEAVSITNIKVTDLDAQDLPTQLNIYVNNGFVDLPKSENIIFLLGDGIRDGQVRIKGSQTAINNCIENMVFTPYSFFHGDTQINFIFSDLGNSGAGGIKTATASVTVLVHEILAPVIVSDLTAVNACSGATATFSILVDAYKPTYKWIKNNKILDHETNSYLTITDLDQTDIADYTCLVSNLKGEIRSSRVMLNVKEVVYSTSVEPSPCYGENNGRITIQPMYGYGAYRFFINDKEVQADNTKLYAGTYNIKVVDGNGCSTEQTAIIQQAEQLSYTLNTTESPCANYPEGKLNITINEPLGRLEYHLKNENFESVNYSGQFDKLKAGSYTLNMIDKNKCTTPIAVEIPGVEDEIELSISEQPLVCFADANAGLSVDFTGGKAPYTLLWQKEEEQVTKSVADNGIYEIQLQNGNSAGNYYFSVVDGNNCMLDTNYILTEPNEITLNIKENLAEYCSGTQSGRLDVEAINGVGSLLYAIDQGNYTTQGVFDRLNSGVHLVQVKDQHNCVANFDIELKASYYPPRDVDFKVQTIDARRAILFLNRTDNIDSIKWDFGDGNKIDWTVNYNKWREGHVYAAFGDYAVTMAVSNRCATDSITKIVHAIGSTSIDDDIVNKRISIYPNPAKDIVNVYWPQNINLSACNYIIINTLGSTVLSGVIDNNQIDISRLRKGWYIIELSLLNKKIQQKLIVE